MKRRRLSQIIKIKQIQPIIDFSQWENQDNVDFD
ncbi:unnamed protein product [Paramecium primaurelia]|uniref:Uncharacterized protein n=1 Tax=Paramecium primaurelia TaxID=5886 RepID=A0A8S1Q8G6_PARPR|nr:unnamed protein product [Paramecium primaurelia]CAD8111948.1 unnamed protein product [Paramecium primaurelia]